MNIIQIIKSFKEGNNTYNGNQFIFKIKENESYETYYTVSLSGDDEYRDVFLSSGIVYKNDGITIYECSEGHEDNFSNDIKNGLYDKLSRLPMLNILETEFEYDFMTGCFDYESLSFEDIK